MKKKEKQKKKNVGAKIGNGLLPIEHEAGCWSGSAGHAGAHAGRAGRWGAGRWARECWALGTEWYGRAGARGALRRALGRVQ